MTIHLNIVCNFMLPVPTLTTTVYSYTCTDAENLSSCFIKFIINYGGKVYKKCA
jgi:hypothetical protein